MAQHLDEANRVADFKIKQLKKEQQSLYRRALEEQRNQINSRTLANKSESLKKDREMVQGLNFFVSSEDRNPLRSKQKRILETKMMEDNMMFKKQALQEAKQVEDKEKNAMAEAIKRIKEEDIKKAEIERQNKVRIVNALKESYNIQEEFKNKEKNDNKQLDRVYSERHREKLIQADMERQQVILLIM